MSLLDDVITDFLAWKRIIYWSSVGYVHDGIESSLTVGSQVSVRGDDDDGGT